MRQYAIRGIQLQLAEGDLFGFIGPNGAGKTTTMRILSTLLNPSWGEAYVAGYSIYTHPKEIRRLVGFMPDFFGVYDDMRVIEYLDFFAAAYRIRGRGVARGARKCWSSSIWPSSETLTPTHCRAVRPSDWGWPASCCTIRKSCCWMNRSADWIPALASTCGICCDSWERWARPLSCPAIFCRNWPTSVIKLALLTAA